MAAYKKCFSAIETVRVTMAVVVLVSLLHTNSILAADVRIPQIDAYIDGHVQSRRFNGSVLIAENNEVLMSKGYGMANYEHDVPNMPFTKFRIGSITKQFTAMAIIILKERRLLHLEDTLDQYVQGFKSGDKITIHHLLTHTSGIPSIEGFPAFMESGMLPWSPVTAIEMIKAEELEFEPGSEFRYNNSGYFLLGYIIEQISGKSYPQFISDNIFNPLGMKNSGYDDHSPILKNRASGYDVTYDGLINAPYLVINNHYAAGALFSTVEDLYVWDRALYGGRLVSKRSLEQIFSGYHSASFEDIQARYGYGVFVGELFGRRHIFHTGTNSGYRALISRFPDDGVAIILLSNFYTPHIGKIGRGVAAILFGEEYEQPSNLREHKVVVDSEHEHYKDFVGTYHREYSNPQDFSIAVILKDGHVVNRIVPRYVVQIIEREGALYFARGADLGVGGHKEKLLPESQDTFFKPNGDEKIMFVRNDAGEVERLVIHTEGGSDIVCRKAE